jgi:hypothetical protein
LAGKLNIAIIEADGSIFKLATGSLLFVFDASPAGLHP